MKVSIIIPTYNEEKVIEECLKSLSHQSYKDLEVIIVDDGSADNTLGIIKNYSPPAGGFNFQTLKQMHLGAGSARNKGVKRAKGEILVFVDADMTFDRDFIKKLVDPILKGKTKGTFSKDEHVSNWDNVWARCLNIQKGWVRGKRHVKNYPNKQKVFRAILKSEFDRVEGFDPGGYTDDWSLSEKLGFEAISAPGAKFYHENAGTLREVFWEARWVGKRKYKFGITGIIVAILRASLPVSLVVGLTKSIIHKEIAFLLYKIVFDFGLIVGIIEFNVLKSGVK